MVNYLYGLKKNFSKRGIFFSFSGPLSQEVMVEIGSTLKQKMKLEEASKKTVIRVFSMVVENAQNIIYYSAEERHGIITVGTEDEHYFVLSGNMVKNEKVERLSKKLTKLKTMNKDELKTYYKEKRKNGPDEESKGGGLGFIEMARKASRPIEYSFKKIDEKYSFFSVKIII
jgi:hypothetical protein